MNVLLTCMYVCTYITCVWCLWSSEEDSGSSGSGVIVVSHHLAAGNQPKQQVILTAELSLQIFDIILNTSSSSKKNMTAIH